MIKAIVSLLAHSFLPGQDRKVDTSAIWQYIFNLHEGAEKQMLFAFRVNPNAEAQKQMIKLLGKTALRIPSFVPTLKKLLEEAKIKPGTQVGRAVKKGHPKAKPPYKVSRPPAMHLPPVSYREPPGLKHIRITRGGVAGSLKSGASEKTMKLPGSTDSRQQSTRTAAAKKAVKKAAKKSAAKKGAIKKSFAKKFKPPFSPSPKPTKVDCYTRVTCDSQVLIKKTTIVRVELSRASLKALKDKLTKEAKGKVEINIPLTVSIHAIKNIRIKGSFTQQTTVPEQGEVFTLNFGIAPTHLGKVKFSIEVWQEQVPVCTLELEPLCVKTKMKEGKTRAKVEILEFDPFPAPVIQLLIRERDEGKFSYYDYELKSPVLKLDAQFTSAPINGNRAEYVSELYQQIENLWETVGDSIPQFASELRNFGGHLYDALFPEELQKILFKNAKKIDSIQVISSEPFIPWELVLIKDPDDRQPVHKKHKFLGELGLIRWLQKWKPVTELHVRKGQAKYIIPEYLDPEYILPAGKKERSYLKKKFSATEVPAIPETIEKLLQKPGSFDLLHLCCHGEGETNKITFAKLRMKERIVQQRIKPAYLTQLSIDQCGSISKNEKHRPIVVLNACRVGKSGNALSGYGGFANAFLKAGAGAFIGSHWSIEDNPAAAFITTFYDQMKKGLTLAEAVTEARKIARKQNDATWISYVIYGHPFAKLK